MANPTKLVRPLNAKLPFEVLNMDNVDEPARINIYDIIGETWWDDGVTGKAFNQEVISLGKTRDIDVHINSLGGDVVDGTLIYSTLLNHQGKVNIIIDGWAVSMASIIAMAGDTVEMSSMGLMMIHKPLNGCYGNADDMQKNIQLLDKVEGALSTAYINKTGLSAEEIAAMLTAETWMTAAEALEHGFIDSITDETGSSPSNCFSKDLVNQFKNAPQAVLDIVNTVTDDESTEEEDESTNEPEETDNTDESEQSTDTTDSADNTNEPELTDTEIENNRVLEIMNQCKALGLESMAMNLIKDKTSLKNVGIILSNVKAGMDDNNQTHNQHHNDLQTKTSLSDSWGAAMKSIK